MYTSDFPSSIFNSYQEFCVRDNIRYKSSIEDWLIDWIICYIAWWKCINPIFWPNSLHGVTATSGAECLKRHDLLLKCICCSFPSLTAWRISCEFEGPNCWKTLVYTCWCLLPEMLLNLWSCLRNQESLCKFWILRLIYCIVILRLIYCIVTDIFCILKKLVYAHLKHALYTLAETVDLQGYYFFLFLFVISSSLL